MHLYSLFLQPPALALAEARLAPVRLHAVARNEDEARRAAAGEAFFPHLARPGTPSPANPWTDPARSGCLLFLPRHASQAKPFAGGARRVGAFGARESHPGVAELTPELRLLRARSHAQKIEDRPVPDAELAAGAWDLEAKDGAVAVAWKDRPIFAVHFLPDGLDLYRFPAEEDAFQRLS